LAQGPKLGSLTVFVGNVEAHFHATKSIEDLHETIYGERCARVPVGGPLYGGWAVRRYSPRGELLETVRLPCANVTKLAFGGEDLRTAFVTTLTPDQAALQPWRAACLPLKPACLD
jgi:hypothetical protein